MNSKNPNSIDAYIKLKLSLKLMGWKPKGKSYGSRSPFAWIDPTKQLQIRRLSSEQNAHLYALITVKNYEVQILDKSNSYLDLLECVIDFNMNRIKK